MRQFSSRRWLVASVLALAVAALAAQASYRLTINGKAASGTAITVKGETYVPLKALKAAGMKATIDGGVLNLDFQPAGGAGQVGAQEGGINDWLFDGVWRFRVLSVDKHADGSGWDVKVELRNGTKTDDLSLAGTGFDSLHLVLDDGKLLDAYNITDIRDKGFPQGAGETIVLQFGGDDLGDRKPDKLLLTIKPDEDLKKYMAGSLKIAYSTGDPSFRVKL